MRISALQMKDAPYNDPGFAQHQASDYLAAAAKSILGAVPFAGSLLVEIAGTIIPNQRIDRLAKFAISLEERLKKFDQQVVKARLSDENFTDLFEEGIRQAARAISDERRGYIASAVASGIDADTLATIEARSMLRILGEINDIEVIWLRSYLLHHVEADKDFRQKHSNILERVWSPVGCGREVLDKEAHQKGWLHHLAQLGLLSPEYRQILGTHEQEIDSFTGAPKLRGYQLTWMGDLLLRYIGLAKEGTGYFPRSEPL